MFPEIAKIIFFELKKCFLLKTFFSETIFFFEIVTLINIFCVICSSLLNIQTLFSAHNMEHRFKTFWKFGRGGISIFFKMKNVICIWYNAFCIFQLMRRLQGSTIGLYMGDCQGRRFFQTPIIFIMEVAPAGRHVFLFQKFLVVRKG